MENLQDIINNLQNNIENQDFQEVCDTVIQKIKMLSSPQDAIDPLLTFMAEYPDLNYGMPGAFVHFIETFPEDTYADQLINSIKKHPTEHNTWMLLRIMNAWNSSRQNEYIGVMKEALENPAISENLKQTLLEDLEDFEE